MTKSKTSRKVSHRIRSAGTRVVKSGVLKSKPRKSGYRIVGHTTDGVAILRPKVRPKHFTSRQIRSTISQIQKAY